MPPKIRTWFRKASAMDGDELTILFAASDTARDGMPTIALAWKGDGCESTMVLDKSDIDWMIASFERARGHWERWEAAQSTGGSSPFRPNAIGGTDE